MADVFMTHIHGQKGLDTIVDLHYQQFLLILKGASNFHTCPHVWITKKGLVTLGCIKEEILLCDCVLFKIGRSR